MHPMTGSKNELLYHVRITLGPIAMPSEIEFVQSLPKTRSGKIMRRVLKAKKSWGWTPGTFLDSGRVNRTFGIITQLFKYCFVAFINMKVRPEDSLKIRKYCGLRKSD